MNGMLYDLFNAGAERRVIGPLRYDLLANLQGEVVELGAGTGANFRYYSPAAHVLALEPDRSMMRRAETKIAQASAQIDLRVGDDLFLDTLPSNSADAVVLTLVLCTVEDPALTLRRVKRLLKPEGTIVVLEHVRSSGNVGRFQDFVAPLWRRIAGGCHLNRDTADTIAAAGFDAGALQTKSLSRLSLIQKLIYGRVRLTSVPLSGSPRATTNQPGDLRPCGCPLDA